MIDPGAMGTLMIGLESVRNDARWTDEGTPIRPRRTSRLRAGIASRLRSVADRLAPADSPVRGTARA